MPKISDKHVSIASVSEIKEICNPLLSVGITYFEYIKIYKDNSRAWLSTNAERTRTLYDKDTAETSKFNLNALQNTRYILSQELIKTLPSNKSINEAYEKIIESREMYNIDNLLQIIINKNDGSFETLVFGTNKNTASFPGKYFELLGFLESFCSNFYDIGGDLIRKAIKEKIIMSTECDSMAICDEESEISLLPMHKKYYLHAGDKKKYLTCREFEVLHLIHNGFSRKNISLQLNLSRKTIDSLISNAVLRTNSININKLLTYMSKNHFFSRF